MIALERILVATDFGEAAGAALTYGRALARTFGSRLHVLHVAENLFTRGIGGEAYLSAFPELQRDLEDTARRQLHELLVDNDPGRAPVQPVLLTSNTTALAIAEYARRERIDLIVMGTHGRGAVAHLLMGSVAERVVRTAPCLVLTVRHPERDFVVPDTLAAIQRA